MSKGSRHGGKGRKGRKSHRYARPSMPIAAKPPVSEASVSATRPAPQQAPAARPAPRPTTAVQQALPSYPYMLRDLKTIGIIAGALLILMIILAVVL
ncbi:MAG: hypothetical protein FJ012_10145 [Chloroflexi bacterium]|nr:hypothetical protein [Chloroflexota bacterium]